MTDPRQSLLDAGTRLARCVDFEALDTDRLCREAAVDPATFAATFGDLTGYLAALQERFMAALIDRMLAATAGMRPGLLRIQVAIEAFLGHCLAEHALRGWLLAARERPEIFAVLERQNRTYALLIGSELHALGWPHPQAAARMLLAMINEAALAEHRLGQPSAEIREALWDFLQHGGARR
ncbi:hypothetical protein SAMN04488120_106154 [Fontimonas thermophila]|uniref:Transcriptional regulator, TetR family n=1 Tax=Fontimonas thermophila TaxID=1076937 RepID=A0A1I2JC15_9GAMM|nr:hypothetical protein [Fontimonas thermophila]SFF51859.1 hypothetical protein SAMN04488120_106154 [Fontimonas thermophila]